MHRTLVTRAAYLAELNRQLRAHPDYVPGMQFIAHGEDVEAAAGFDWVPNDGGTPPTPFAEVAVEVHSQYRVQDKTTWVALFAAVLIELRPHLSARMAHDIGEQEFNPNSDPRATARAYHVTRGGWLPAAKD